jgi:uncharacterized protein (TIGR02594 family)
MSAPWVDIARADLDAGVKRRAGKAAHPRIIEYYDTCGLAHDSDDEQSYCGAGMGTWLHEAGYPMPKGAYGAKTFEAYGRPLETFEPGCICVWYRTALREKDWRRHVNIGLRETETHIECLGANQRGGAVTIQMYPKKDLVAMRWPVKATVKDLLSAGSEGVKVAKHIKQGVIATGGTAASGAAVNQATKEPPPVIPETLTQASDQISYFQTFVEGCNAVVGLVFAHPWLVAGVVVLLGGWWAASRIEKGVVRSAELGQPIDIAG